MFSVQFFLFSLLLLNSQNVEGGRCMRAGNFVKLTKYYHNAEEGWGGQTKPGIYLTSGEVMESYKRSK